MEERLIGFPRAKWKSFSQLTWHMAIPITHSRYNSRSWMDFLTVIGVLGGQLSFLLLQLQHFFEKLEQFVATTI
jgi:hypothetical protein